MKTHVGILQQAAAALAALDPIERRVSQGDFSMEVGPFEIEVFQMSREDGSLHMRLVIENVNCKNCNDWDRLEVGVEKGGELYLSGVEPIENEPGRVEAFLDVPDVEGYELAIKVRSGRKIPRQERTVH